jgi:hypothetical protein
VTSTALTGAPAGTGPFKRITAVLPDDGTDLTVLKALRRELGIVTARSMACRGLSILAAAETKPGKLPEPTHACTVEVLVPAPEADDVFEFVCQRANINRLHGGVVMLGSTAFCTPFQLPEGLPEEED